MGIQKIGNSWNRKLSASEAHEDIGPSTQVDQERSSSDVPSQHSPHSENQREAVPSSQAPQPFLTFDDSVIAKIAEAVFHKLQSEGWTAPPSSTLIPSSSSADPTDQNQSLVPHHAMLFQQQTETRSEIASLHEKVNSLIGRQLDIERRMLDFSRDFQTMATTLKEAIPQTDFGVAINKYTDLELEAQRNRESLDQITKSMKKLREAVDGKNEFIQDSYTKLNSSQASLEQSIMHVSTLLKDFLEPSTQTPLQSSAKEKSPAPTAPPMHPPSTRQPPCGKRMKTAARKKAVPPARMRSPRTCSMRSGKRTKSNSGDPINISGSESKSSHGDSTQSSD